MQGDNTGILPPVEVLLRICVRRRERERERERKREREREREVPSPFDPAVTIAAMPANPRSMTVRAHKKSDIRVNGHVVNAFRGFGVHLVNLCAQNDTSVARTPPGAGSGPASSNQPTRVPRSCFGECVLVHLSPSHAGTAANQGSMIVILSD